ncbi:hypothetical protein WICPIJ_005646 [Wickerhamomyces pijperi]|uniref:Uncharacterized protein n=1 Tax=Wickerhamomyces pijperi TaxID=599730 RepID=A0A9P8TLQ7_WICPI|nr:hypothetical protein WICPIJ_005646 [Wickerhamomyces pijperi]
MRYNIIVPIILSAIAEAQASPEEARQQLVAEAGSIKPVTEVKIISKEQSPILVNETGYNTVKAPAPIDGSYLGQEDNDYAYLSYNPSSAANGDYNIDEHIFQMDSEENYGDERGHDAAIQELLIREESAYKEKGPSGYNAEYFRKHFNANEEDLLVTIASPYHLAPKYDGKVHPEERKKLKLKDGHNKNLNYPGAVPVPVSNPQTAPGSHYVGDQNEYLFDSQHPGNEKNEYEKFPAEEQDEDLAHWERILSEERARKEKEKNLNNVLAPGSSENKKVSEEEETTKTTKGKQVLEESESGILFKNSTFLERTSNASNSSNSSSGRWQRGGRESLLEHDFLENSSTKLVATLGFSVALSLVVLLF